MIFREPLLLLKRLVVLHRGLPAYDQKFHDGVNIIRGTNSSGKSTILDFIFYALGGDFTGWKPEAESCQTVLAEVEINEEIVTLRRGIAEQSKQPMEIFWGSLDDASKSPFEGWERHSFARSDSRASFSQVLFKALKLPELKNEATSNITMHQLLRLICVDQLSGVSSLLRDELWDSATTRKAVGDLLYGLYDDQLYSDQLALRDAERDLERAKAEHTSLQRALLDAGQLVDLNEIEDRRRVFAEQLEATRLGIAASQGSYDVPDAPDESASLRALEEQIRTVKRRYAELVRESDSAELELEDSNAFIANLSKRLTALDDSVAAERALGRLTLQICPECLQQIDDSHVDGQCFLCKQPNNGGFQKHIARLRNELSAQIHESKNLLEKKQRIAVQAKRLSETELIALTELEKRFGDIVARLRSRRDAHLDEMLEKKGSLEGSIRLLDSQKKLAQRLQDTLGRIHLLQLRVETLHRSIRDAQGRQSSRRIEAENCVERLVKEFLKRDLQREELFSVAQSVTVDFERNLCLVDKRASFSASSISYLKAAVHFSILFASLELPFFRYPKLVVNDNIEDKGMEEARSKNLQRIVVEYSKKAKVRHQIILATSMVDPSLDNEEFCIGPFYTLENKTLRMSRTETVGV